MQAAKKAVETIKETAANIGASAKSGLEKTKATVQEKGERMSGRDPMQKDMATQKKEERINHAEMQKKEAREHNAVAKLSAIAGHVTEGKGHYTTNGPATENAAAAYSTTSEYGPGQPMGSSQMSAMPAHGDGLGLRHEGLTDNVMDSHPIGTNTGMGTTAAHNVPLTDNVVGSHPMGTITAHNVPITDNLVGSHPIGTNTGMSTTTAHDVPVGGTAPGSGPNFS